MDLSAALHNTQIICRKFFKILINTYRLPVSVTVYGSKNILLVESIIQGGNLAMSFYALGTTPLLGNLKISSLT